MPWGPAWTVSGSSAAAPLWPAPMDPPLSLICQQNCIERECITYTKTHTKSRALTLWKRLCFIEIQQTSTGCFADLGNRNRAWILFKQTKWKPMAIFVICQKTPKTLSTCGPNWGNVATFWAPSWSTNVSLSCRELNENKSMSHTGLWLRLSKMLVYEVKNQNAPRVLREGLKQCSGLFLCPGLVVW